MARIFGFEITKAKDEAPPPSFAPKIQDDGAITVTAGASQGSYIDLEGSVKTEAEVVTKYRQMSFHPELDSAIDDIVNESIIVEENTPIVELVLDDLDKIGVDDTFKEILQSEFDRVLELLEFNSRAYEIFRQWYVDGRLYYNIIPNQIDPTLGIQEIRYLDPRKIKKIREVKQVQDDKTRKIAGSENIQKIVDEYYIYNEMGFSNGPTNSSNLYGAKATTGIKIAKDSIAYVTSGLISPDNTLVLSHLHKCIKVMNMLRSLEDASIIYRVSRAPERRVFYVDTGNLPKMKAEQYIRELMTKFKNRLVYDSHTGEIKDDRKIMTILEDFWLARRGGDQGTKIETLPGGQSQGIMDEIEYFRMALYKALNIPYSRYNPENTYSVGRATEITRDEVKFAKFIDRLRVKFSTLFLKLLRVQLIFKGIITPEEWNELEQKIKFKYARDNLFSELKEKEIMIERAQTLDAYVPYVGRYYSNEWVMKNILRLDEDEIEKMQKQILIEMENPMLNPEINMLNQDQPVLPNAQPRNKRN